MMLVLPPLCISARQCCSLRWNSHAHALKLEGRACSCTGCSGNLQSTPLPCPLGATHLSTHAASLLCLWL